MKPTLGYFNKENCIYKIVHDFDLEGETLTIPSGCTLDFQGGKITYTYYEDESTGNYVKHGTFKFIKKECIFSLIHSFCYSKLYLFIEYTLLPSVSK